MEWKVILGGTVLVRAAAWICPVLLAGLVALPANGQSGGCNKGALVVDIGGSPANGNGDGLGLATSVPYVEGAGENPATTAFRQDFRDNMDGLLLARGVRHDHPVILLAPSLQVGELAADNLREHGFTHVYVARAR